ncbi:MAG: tRNA (guanosine(46)-N7)-methyltransferase TrmB [Campylobacter sp.]|nr:tRNA (guanosine(46)-N7)-methyltransferase TrmB [Campylobacter sp.]
MPNFITSKIKELAPFKKDGVEFLGWASSGNFTLFFTRVYEDEFLLMLGKKSSTFVVKAEKSTRPAKIAHIQKALEVFRDEFCEGVISEAFSFKPKEILKKSYQQENKDKILDFIKDDKNIHIEVGFGSGRHLLYQAKNRQDDIFVGVEIYKPALQQVSKLAYNARLSNLLLVDFDARIFFDTLPSNCVDTVFLHFPVPWDDSPSRRVVSSEFLSSTQRILKVGGKFELRTDSLNYAEFSLQKILELDLVKTEIYKNKDIGISSKYEDRWKKFHKDIFDIVVTNELKSDESSKTYDMSFDFKIDTDKLQKEFKKETYKLENAFVHLEEIYEINSGGVLIKLSLGAFNKPESKFIVAIKNSTNYYIKPPLNTLTNFTAHQKVKEILSKWRE